MSSHKKKLLIENTIAYRHMFVVLHIQFNILNSLNSNCTFCYDFKKGKKENDDPQNFYRVYLIVHFSINKKLAKILAFKNFGMHSHDGMI